MTSTTFIFSNDSPCSTTIYLRGHESDPVYTVESAEESKGRVQTTVYDRARRKLARLEWRGDVVYLGEATNGEKMNSWMKKSMMPFTKTRSFSDDLGRKYKWHGCEAGGRMMLKATDTGNTPLAGFEKASGEGSSKAKLTLSPRAMEIQDLVVISFLFLEKERRIQEQYVFHTHSQRYKLRVIPALRKAMRWEQFSLLTGFVRILWRRTLLVLARAKASECEGLWPGGWTVLDLKYLQRALGWRVEAP